MLEAETWIVRLNTLRNRIWHRGAFVLRYPALDRLVGGFILPFVKSVTNLPSYRGKEQFWKYKRLSSGIDPIEEMIRVCKFEKLDIGNVAFLKEMDRAAFECPYYNNKFYSHYDSQIRKRMELAAAQERHDPSVADVTDCPVCGSKCLVVFDDIETEGEDPYEGTYQVECRVCSFTVNHHLKNPSEYGLNGISDYWKTEEF